MTSLNSGVKWVMKKKNKIITYRLKKFIYEGKTKNNKLNGTCILRDIKGNLIKGTFKDNKLNGKGFFSGSKELADTLKFNLPEFKLSTPREIIIIGKFKNDLIDGKNIQIFSSNGNYGLITYNNGKITSGWTAEEQGSFFTSVYSDKYNDYEIIENPEIKNELNYLYILDNENYFKKKGWFPSQLCENKEIFKKTILKWKKEREFF
jgi:hypothetical protein|tara:strand:- start:37 stop:654 length:618 start_codon:yes stop_codon:yes gene_type:complete